VDPITVGAEFHSRLSKLKKTVETSRKKEKLSAE
jgi:hypothetical protein